MPDIHDVVEHLPEFAEALVIGAEEPDGGYWMLLFVVLADGVGLDDSLRDRRRWRGGTPSADVR